MQFETSWHADQLTSLQSWIQDHAPSLSPARRTYLTEELVKIDLELSWKSGCQRHLETYASVLSSVLPAPSLDLLQEEYRVRHRWGDKPTVQEYVTRFGELGGKFAASTTRREQLEDTQPIRQDGAQLSRGSSNLPPVVGRYRILRLIGEGTFARVFLARDPTLNRHVALKIPKFDFQGVEEAVLAASAQHPAFVSIYDVIEEADTSIIVMEYINGGTLDTWCAAPSFHLEAGIELLAQVAQALHHIHQLGLVHCDLKPSNILVDEKDQPRIADFGLAINQNWQGSLPFDNQFGTPAFMSPEQVRGETKWLDARTDSWALGVILYQMLTKRLPFDGQNLPLLFDQILYHEPSRGKVDSAVAARLLDASLQCLVKDVWERPDCERFAQELNLLQRSWKQDRIESPRLPTARISLPSTLPEVEQFVGRDQELQTCREALLGDATLLTIHGPGGIGKTLFAGVLMRAMADDFRAHVHVPLAHGRTSDFLRQALAASLNIEAESCDDIHILDRLRGGPTLVLLDNFEQLPDEATHQLEEWARALPHTKWIVTSRRRLKLRRENVVSLGPLQVADDSTADGCSESMRLFHATAQRVAPEFPLDEHRATIHDICQHLEGIPLALELAASRLSVLDPQQILNRLSEAAFLTSDELSVQPRHRTLQATVQWSLDLLDDRQSTALLILSLLPGGCRVDAAEAMLADVHPAPLNCIQDLLSQSLICSAHTPRGRVVTVFRCVAEVVRQIFTHDQRDAAWQRILRPLVDHCTNLASQLDRQPTKNVLADLFAERENLAACQRWAKHESQGDAATRCGLLLATSLRFRGLLSAEQAVLDDEYHPRSLDLQTELAIARSQNALRRGELEVARRLFADSMQLLDKQADTSFRHRCRLLEGEIYVAAKQWQQAEPCFRSLLESEDLTRIDQCACWLNLARTQENQGFIVDAEASYGTARQLAQQVGNRLLETRIFRHHANLLLRQARLKEAETLLRQAQQIAEEAEYQSEAHLALTSLGIVACERAEFSKAIRLFLQARESAQSIGGLRSVAVNEGNRGVALALSGDQVAAIQCLRGAEDLNQRLGNEAAGGLNRLNRALSVCVLGDPDEALELARSAIQTLDRCQDRFNGAIARGDLGIILTIFGDHRRAEEELEAAWHELCQLGLQRSRQAAATIVALAERKVLDKNPAETIGPEHKKMLRWLHRQRGDLPPHLLLDRLPDRIEKIAKALNFEN